MVPTETGKKMFVERPKSVTDSFDRGGSCNYTVCATGAESYATIIAMMSTTRYFSVRRKKSFLAPVRRPLFSVHASAPTIICERSFPRTSTAVVYASGFVCLFLFFLSTAVFLTALSANRFADRRNNISTFGAIKIPITLNPLPLHPQPPILRFSPLKETIWFYEIYLFAGRAYTSRGRWMTAYLQFYRFASER